MLKAALKSCGGAVAGLYLGLHPLVQTLLILMGLDVITGLVAAFVTKTLSSDVSFRGLAKKVLMLLVVAAASVMARAWQLDVPMGAIAAGFYCVHELISLLENTVRAGVPVPQAIAEAVDRLKRTPTARAFVAAQPTGLNGNLNGNGGFTGPSGR